MSLKRALSLLLIVFLIFFPKGGIKMGGVPLTWGYLLIALLIPIISVRKQHSLSPLKTTALAAQLPFQLIALTSITLNGFLHTGHLIALFVSIS